MYLYSAHSIRKANGGLATFSTMVGGVISDFYHADERNTPMVLFSAAALFGTGLAPLLSSIIVYHTTWRWIYYSHAIVSGVFVVLIFFSFKETRGSVLLSKKAGALNKYYEKLEAAGHYGVIMGENADGEKVKRIRWKVKSDEQRASLGKMISISLYRPFRKLALISYRLQDPDRLTTVDMFIMEPVVFFFSIWVAFCWAVLYLQFSSVPLVFQTNHKFNIEQSGAVFTCISLPLSTYGKSLTTFSCVCRSPHYRHYKCLPGKNRVALHKTPQHGRTTDLLCLCGGCPFAHWSLLVWVDVLPVYSVDRADTCCWLCYYGHFFRLLGCV